MNQDQVARLLGLPLDPTRDLPELDSCGAFDLGLAAEEELLPEEEEPGSVELLEAGALLVKTRGGEIKLAPKHFPGLLPFIAGVVYSEAQTTQVDQEDPLGQVSAASEGGDAVGAFSVETAGPTMPILTGVGSGSAQPPLSLSRGSDLTLTWEPQGGSSPDITYIELRLVQGNEERVLRCRPVDDGSFTIPQHLLGQLSGRVTLELARLRRMFFSAIGLDEGELRVTMVDGHQLQLQP